MTLSNFCRMGKATLTRAIGLQKNFKEIILTGPDKLDQYKSGCLSCPVHKAKNQLEMIGLSAQSNILNEKCHGCSSAVWEKQYEIKYINERNIYGYQPRLKSNALKLLIVYHFLQPDQLGIIKNINVKDLALILQVDERTITYNNEILSNYGYCHFSDSGWGKNQINVLLPDYRNYHKPAAEGGRGYLTFSQDILDTLLPQNLNQLRLTLKGLLETDRQALVSGTAEVDITYDRLRGFLPVYCNRSIIRKTLSDMDTPIFDLQETDTYVTFRLMPDYNGKELRTQYIKENRKEMVDYLDTLNSYIDEAQVTSQEESRESIDMALNILGITLAEQYRPYFLHNNDYDDLAALCVQYSSSIVRQAVIDIYNNYINATPQLVIKNYGGLIRSIIQKRLSYTSFFAAS